MSGIDNDQYEVVATVGSIQELPQLATQHRIKLDRGQSYTFEMNQRLRNGPTDAITITAAAEVIEIDQR
ncbi:MAG: hypothetical protein AB8B87_19865 [Granulosicoccus sp.]